MFHVLKSARKKIKNEKILNYLRDAMMAQNEQ